MCPKRRRRSGHALLTSPLRSHQHAADNKYADGVTPTLSVVITDAVIIVQCNEVRFDAANVDAICKIGASTKTNQKGLIGEKGIRFKSVFWVADAVYICSTDYMFKLDKNVELGMITPSWSDWYPTNLVGIEDSCTSLEIFLTIKHMTKMFTKESKRLGIKESEFVLAFPLTERGEPKIEPQNVFAYLPVKSFGFLRCAIFRSADGTYRLPSECVILIQEFRGRDLQPLIPEEFLPNDLHYLADSYDFHTDSSHFERLKVRCMSSDDFIAGLKNMNHIICNQPDLWQESVCSRLSVIYHECRKQQSAQKLMQNSTISEIRQVCILPLSDGSWVSASCERDIWFDSMEVGIPQDLGLQLVRADLNDSVARPAFFRALGVKTTDPEMITTKILQLHVSGSHSRSPELLMQHACFLFVHRYTKAVPLPTSLWLVDRQGEVIEGTEAYCDFPDVPREVKLDGVLLSPAKFLHTNYLHYQDWWKWLRDGVSVNNYPRLVNNGKLSPEFLALTQTIDTHLLLILLKETWPQWQGGQLKKYSLLPFLPINTPAHRDWDFLSDLGVMGRVDVDFFIERLIRLSDEGSENEEAIQAVYEQIQARFEDNPKRICAAFEENVLIFASPDKDSKKKWISKSDVIWKGPASIKSKIALMPSCYLFQKLFRDQLGIAAAGPGTLVDKLQALAEEWKGKSILVTVSENISALLFDISKLILEAEPYDPSSIWLFELANEAIFPVATPLGELTLCTCEHFYVPDSNGCKFLFVQRVVAQNPRPVRQVQEFLTKLRATHAFTVDSIESTYILNGHTRMATEEVAIEQKGNSIAILLSAGFLSECNVFIGKELALLLEVDMSMLLIILAFPPDMVELTLKTQGILCVPEDLFCDKTSWINDANAQVDNKCQSSKVVPLRHPLHVLNKSISIKQQIKDFVGGMQNMKYDLFQPDQIITSPFHRGIAFPKHISKNPGVGNLPSADDDGDDNDNDNTSGSEYKAIYLVLSKALPNFGPENWTSQFRVVYPGLELEYMADGMATFQYSDSDGAMTSWLYDDETKEAWNGDWPTYYLNVKSTSGRVGKTFLMSVEEADLLQLATLFLTDIIHWQVLRLTVCDSATPPKEQYAIIRVANIRMSPSYTIYSDPHRLVYEGTLQTKSLLTSLSGKRWVSGS
ncbi:hypothetical protein PILCRDRAFT_88871 [Piloderma croceum F 1598]|uniref:Uncharacterized protein n=1 Tax=Piloderma croceum (strain F 1598) TaxID=765440 RepID=A0A0C3BXQ5_PILCF|nr:hypothetical protein PILCRDRAFT_88871 [Piloderma croceum F 1598]